ncbi:MAG: pantoate--beta-alanine ligase [Pseudomonadota bacterium]
MIGLPLLRSASQLRSRVKSWRAFGETTVVVPIFGLPHAGHAHVLREAAQHGDRILAALVPPAVPEGADAADGPSPHEPQAVALADEAGADAIYVPSTAVFRPAGFASLLHVGGLSEVLDGEERPDAFDAFSADIARLFSQAQPDVAVFCACEWQSMAIARRIAADFDLCGSVVAVEQERAEDGVPCTRTTYEIDEAGRADAVRLWRALTRAAADIDGGQNADAVLDAAADALADAGAEVEYFDLRDAATLQEVSAPEPQRPARIFAAIQTAGSVRLLDNVPLGGR